MIIHIHSFSDLLRPYQPLSLFRRLVNIAPNPVLVGLHPRGHFKCSESQFKKLTLAGDVAQLLSSCLAWMKLWVWYLASHKPCVVAPAYNLITGGVEVKRSEIKLILNYILNLRTPWDTPDPEPGVLGLATQACNPSDLIDRGGKYKRSSQPGQLGEALSQKV